MTKLRSISITQAQRRRVIRCGVGGGFMVYRYSHNADGSDTVGFGEFKLSPEGDVLNVDGAPLEYTVEDGGKSYRYRWTREEVK